MESFRHHVMYLIFVKTQVTLYELAILYQTGWMSGVI